MEDNSKIMFTNFLKMPKIYKIKSIISFRIKESKLLMCLLLHPQTIWFKVKKKSKLKMEKVIRNKKTRNKH